jgi:transcriptional regulator with XRE-family HTH domain
MRHEELDHLTQCRQNLAESIYSMTTETPSNTFGERMFAVRKTRKWSQPELAEKVGTSAPVISRYERGATLPSIDAAKRIADALGVPLDSLVSEESGPNLFQDKETYERCKAIINLPESERNHIFFIIDSVIRDSRARVTYS